MKHPALDRELDRELLQHEVQGSLYGFDVDRRAFLKMLEPAIQRRLPAAASSRARRASSSSMRARCFCTSLRSMAGTN
jgi:hypothetical protein